MTIRMKRVYEPMAVSDGFRVLVDRIWPRGVSRENAHIDLWMRDIAPSNQLRKWYGHELGKWPEFRRRYLDELGRRTDLLQMLADIEHDQKTLTLVFGAHDVDHSHALVLRDALEHLPAHSHR